MELGYPHTNFDRLPEHSNGTEVEVEVTTNDGGLGPVIHSFPPSHQGGRGTIKGSNRLPSQQPSKRMNRTPFSKDTCRNAKKKPQGSEAKVFSRRGSPNLPDHPKQQSGRPPENPCGNLWVDPDVGVASRRKTCLCLYLEVPLWYGPRPVRSAGGTAYPTERMLAVKWDI